MTSSGRMTVGNGQNGFIGRCRREICDQLVLIAGWWFKLGDFTARVWEEEKMKLRKKRLVLRPNGSSNGSDAIGYSLTIIWQWRFPSSISRRFRRIFALCSFSLVLSSRWMRSEGSFQPQVSWTTSDGRASLFSLAGLSMLQPTSIRSELIITIDLMQAAIAWFVRNKRAREQKDVHCWISSTRLDGRQGDCSTYCREANYRGSSCGLRSSAVTGRVQRCAWIHLLTSM
jgi:hypothetical protein